MDAPQGSHHPGPTPFAWSTMIAPWCKKCEGSGVAPDSSPPTICSRCSGSGRRDIYQTSSSSSLGAWTVATTSPTCGAGAGHELGDPISYADGSIVGYCRHCSVRMVVPWLRGGPTAIRARAVAMLAMRSEAPSSGGLLAVLSDLREDRAAVDDAIALVEMAISKGMVGGEGSESGTRTSGSGGSGEGIP